MSRLGKRVERLEGGSGDKTSVWVLVPDGKSQAEQTAAAERLAEEHGMQPPFDLTLLPGKRETAKLLYAGPPLDPMEIWAQIGALNAEEGTVGFPPHQKLFHPSGCGKTW